MHFILHFAIARLRCWEWKGSSDRRGRQLHGLPCSRGALRCRRSTRRPSVSAVVVVFVVVLLPQEAGVRSEDVAARVTNQQR